MAPIRKSSSAATVPRKSILKNSSQPRKLEAESLFSTTKKDKRRIKHAQLLSKVEKVSKTPRRRRPNKKLVTTLDALADALPSDDDDGEIGESRTQDQVNIIKRKSMKSRPGAMKRREKLDKGERDRFAKNLAQMSANSSTSDTVKTPSHEPDTGDRWKALRGFISQTMERKPEMSQQDK